MGKMPLASLIGACSLGMLLSGCTNSKQNMNQPFAGGRTDKNTGLLSRTKAPNNSTAPLAGAP